jgi:hypothetical protein
VPPDTSLNELAGAILRAFKMDSDHLYDFRYRDQRGKSRVYNHPYPDEGPFTTEITVGETDLAIKDDMLFTFDYGDTWQFKARLEQIEDGVCKLGKPKVIESAGKAPEQYSSYYYPDSGIGDTLGGPFGRGRRCSLGQRPLRASFLARALPTAKIPRQLLSSIPLSG